MLLRDSAQISRLSRAAQFSKLALAIGLTVGAVVTVRADDEWGNKCKTWSGECKTGSCGSSSCCLGGYSGVPCLCVEVSSTCPC